MKKIKKWIDLNNLYVYNNGSYKGKIDWGKNIGCKCKFKYSDIEGEVEIVDYNKKTKKLTIKYLDYNLFETEIGSFSKCQFGKLLKKRTNEFKVEIGQIFKDGKRDLTIINREYRKDSENTERKWYKYHCNKCGNEDWVVENNLLKNTGCNVCCNFSQKVALGINTIYDTDKWMIDYLGVSEEDAKKYTSRSSKKIKVKCPYCGKEKELRISGIYYNKSIGCCCGDNISYPEKFITSLLDQINTKYIKEYSPQWSNKKRYDFYLKLNNKKYIIETHGEQHYNKGFKNIGGRNLEEEQNNDKYKKELALNNGIDCYIELDCRKSELKWIKNSIINSELNNIFDLSQIDWLKCEEFALSNRVKEVCDYWHLHNDINNEGLCVKDLKNVFELSCTTIVKYLNKGSKLEWCNYNPEDEKLKGVLKTNNKNKIKLSKTVYIFDKNGKYLGMFTNCSELERKSEELFGTKLYQGSICEVARGDKKQYKGFIFKYKL